MCIQFREGIVGMKGKSHKEGKKQVKRNERARRGSAEKGNEQNKARQRSTSDGRWCRGVLQKPRISL